MDFPHLFSTIQVNQMKLKNRIVMTAMHLGYTPEGEVTDRLTEFYAARAKGGVGLIVVGGCPVDEYGGMPGMLAIHHDRHISGLQQLTGAVKRNGAKIAAQLYQGGRYTHSSMIGGRKPFSASAVRSRLTGETPRPLETEEIPEVQNRFAEAALRAKRAGFDAVEILGSAGYLISQFLSTLTNRRDDQYGGSLENRMRFGLEVAAKVREAVGAGFPILMRLAGNDFMAGGNTNREARIFAAELEIAGVDLFNVTGGWHETRVPQLTMFVPRRAYVYLAQGIKSAVGAPVLASNRINDPQTAEDVIRKGEADLVTMARALLADPDLPQKASSGKTNRIYHCIACNQGCFDNIFRFKPAGCLVNPMAGKESRLQFDQAVKPKKTLVIGGGPAGMKAACTAAERGHTVVLVEKEAALGGQLLLNRDIPGRGEMLTAATDLEENLKALGVNIQLGRPANAELVQEEAPDAVIIATGARPREPEIEGLDGRQVVQAWDILRGNERAGGKVLIVGGNAVGLETALYLAYQGTLAPEVLHFLMVNRAESFETLMSLLDQGNKKVTVVEMAGRAGQDVGASSRWTIMAELRRLGVQVMTGTRAIGVKTEGLEVEKENNREILPADTIVLAAGSAAENRLSKALEGVVNEIHTIGDAKEPRNALEAIQEGFRLGLEI